MQESPLGIEDIRSFVLWVVNEGGASVLAYSVLAFFYDRLWPWMKVKWPWAEKVDLTKAMKRNLSIGVSGLVGLGLGWLGSVLGLYALPTDWLGWLNFAVLVCPGAVVGSSVLHGLIELRGKISAGKDPVFVEDM